MRFCPWAFLCLLLVTVGLSAETVWLDHITTHYYTTHLQLNPTGIIPAGPALDWDAPHGRETLV